MSLDDKLHRLGGDVRRLILQLLSPLECYLHFRIPQYSSKYNIEEVLAKHRHLYPLCVDRGAPIERMELSELIGYMDLRQLKRLSKKVTPDVTWYYSAVRRGNFAIINWLLKDKKIPINREVILICLETCQKDMIVYFGKRDFGNIIYLHEPKKGIVNLRGILREYNPDGLRKAIDKMTSQKNFDSFCRFIFDYRTEYETKNLERLWHEDKRLVFKHLFSSYDSLFEHRISFGGNLELLKWFRETNLCSFYSSSSINGAAAGGHVHILEWLDQPDNKSPYSGTDYTSIFLVSMQNSRFNVMDWALARGAEIKWYGALDPLVKAYVKDPTSEIVSWALERNLFREDAFTYLMNQREYGKVLSLRKDLLDRHLPLPELSEYFIQVLQQRCTQHLDITLDKNRNSASFHYADMLLHNSRIPNCPMCETFGTQVLKEVKISSFNESYYKELSRSFPVDYYCHSSYASPPYSLRIWDSESLKRIYIPCVAEVMRHILE